MSGIISHVIGGLGTQMFQYAAGRALSLIRSEPLFLDVSGFNAYGLHQGFELSDVFCCPVRLAEPQDVRAVLGWQSPRLVRRILARPALRNLRSRHFVVEPYFDYWPGLRNTQLPTYLVGYWQSERYFADVAQTVRSDFTFRQPMTSRNQGLAEEIRSVNSVSLHVRRGDFVNNPKANATHGLCSLDYYEAAVRHIAERVDEPHFFVFSDDIEWVRSNLARRNSFIYVDHNRGPESYNDMRLMSLCKNNIIANSSFSWWGAWLNQNVGKIVLAPKRWFANNNPTSDLLPSGWVSL